MKTKTIIISSEDKKSRGILTLYEEDELLKCKLRLYNAMPLSRYCKIGIYHENQVYSANLLEKSGVYVSSLVGDFNLDKDFYSAIIDTEHNNAVLLSGGSYAGFYFEDNSVFNENIEEHHEKTENLAQEDNKTIFQNCYDCNRCENCQYKKYFYENTTEKTNTCSNEDKKINKADVASLMDAIVPQYKYIFENYELNNELISLIANSKFVNINDESGNYSIGAIYENEKIKYLCYAIKCNYNTPAPNELGRFYQWLPIDKEDPLSEGYYIVYQDAKDLKIIEV